MHPHTVARPQVDAVLHAPRHAAGNDDWGNCDGVRNGSTCKRDKRIVSSIYGHNAQNFFWQ